eukprot:9312739-Prorocentrum_lima.AAC.1
MHYNTHRPEGLASTRWFGAVLARMPCIHSHHPWLSSMLAGECSCFPFDNWVAGQPTGPARIVTPTQL